ncbi:hypothetical protein BDV09DRAFT_162980 [Aspergillus tetrazonus]
MCMLTPPSSQPSFAADCWIGRKCRLITVPGWCILLEFLTFCPTGLHSMLSLRQSLWVWQVETGNRSVTMSSRQWSSRS